MNDNNKKITDLLPELSGGEAYKIVYFLMNLTDVIWSHYFTKINLYCAGFPDDSQECNSGNGGDSEKNP